MTVALTSEASIFSLLDKYRKNPVQRHEMNKSLGVTLVAMAALVGVGLYFIGKPELMLSATGKGLVGLAAPLLTVSTIGLIWNNAEKKGQRTWGIAGIISTALLVFAFTASAAPNRIPLPCSSTQTLIGISAPVVGTSIIKYILERTESFDPALSAKGKTV